MSISEVTICKRLRIIDWYEHEGELGDVFTCN